MTPSIILTLMSELLGGQTTQEARPVVGEGQTPTPASGPQRSKPWRVTQTPSGYRGPTPREQQREARAYAEQWYKALCKWKVAHYELPLPSGTGGSGGGGVLLTSATPGFYPVFYLSTPAGRTVTEVEAGRTITTWSESRVPGQRELGSLLARIRASQSPRSLIDERGGWASPRDRSVAYAVAVLTLAVTLGDRVAEIHLLHLRKSGD